MGSELTRLDLLLRSLAIEVFSPTTDLGTHSCPLLTAKPVRYNSGCGNCWTSRCVYVQFYDTVCTARPIRRRIRKTVAHVRSFHRMRSVIPCRSSDRHVDGERIVTSNGREEVWQSVAGPAPKLRSALSGCSSPIALQHRLRGSSLGRTHPSFGFSTRLTFG